MVWCSGRACGPAFVVASLLALVPLLIAAFSILTTFLIVLALTYLGDIWAIVQFLIAVVDLGVAIDYSLLIATRRREERARGRSNDDAIAIAGTTAGRAVLVSGLTVAIGLVALIVLPEPAMRSIAVGGILNPDHRGGGIADPSALSEMKPWGFELESIGVPVSIWYGDDDHFRAAIPCGVVGRERARCGRPHPAGRGPLVGQAAAARRGWMPLTQGY